ncbi:MAG: twin-arginine translocase subunit TatC [Flavisolibacter sp.]|nr:twin-arginine translocase subunit TatC [Flavisolibacter sp.]
MILRLMGRRKTAGATAMSFTDHLEDLRGHLFRSAIAVVLGCIFLGVYNNFFIKHVLLGPTQTDFPTYKILCYIGKLLHIEALCLGPAGVNLQSIGVSAQFSVFFSVILIGGFILAFPYIFYQIWNFIKPALTPKELKNSGRMIFWVSLLFFLGVGFGYFVIAPYTINFFSNFQLDPSIENRWTISSYLDLLAPLILGTGLAFQLPLAMLFLAKTGIIGSKFLKARRKHAIVIMIIVAGVITPPDVLSQMIVTMPLLLLYEISIKLVKKTEAREALESAKNLHIDP